PGLDRGLATARVPPNDAPVQQHRRRVRRRFETVRPGLGDNERAWRPGRQGARLQEGDPGLLRLVEAGTGKEAIDDRRGLLPRHLPPERLRGTPARTGRERSTR